MVARLGAQVIDALQSCLGPFAWSNHNRLVRRRRPGCAISPPIFDSAHKAGSVHAAGFSSALASSTVPAALHEPRHRSRTSVHSIPLPTMRPICTISRFQGASWRHSPHVPVGGADYRWRQTVPHTAPFNFRPCSRKPSRWVRLSPRMASRQDFVVFAPDFPAAASATTDPGRAIPCSARTGGHEPASRERFCRTADRLGSPLCQNQRASCFLGGCASCRCPAASCPGEKPSHTARDSHPA